MYFSQSLLSTAGEPERTEFEATSRGRPLWAVTITLSPTVRWPEEADWPAKMQLSPILVEPARPVWPQIMLLAPSWEAWPTRTRSSILVPRPMRVSPTVARSMQELDWTSTSSSRTAGPDWTILYQVPSFLFGEAQAVAADDGAGLEDYAVAYAAVFADYGVGVGEEIVADFGALVDGYETVQDCVLAYFDIFVDEAVGADVGALGDSGGPCDDCCRVDAWFVLGWLVEEFEGLGKGQVGVGGA